MAGTATDNSLKADMQLVEDTINEIDLSRIIGGYLWTDGAKSWLSSDKYYRGLAAYCLTFKPSHVLELGTGTGASAACLAEYSGRVLTCDISEAEVCDDRIFGDDVTFKLCSYASDILEIDFREHDLIFVDIDHSGVMERLIHSKLVNEGYAGDVFYDDIFLNLEMRRFWDDVSQSKLALDWHAFGFGVVRYQC